MVPNIKLYINGREVEFSQDPKILYTYQITDITNPTAVKNNFTKQIQIEGTPNNNDIFGQYWNLERITLGGGEGGAYYNSSKKAPFQLFVGSDLYEDGYVKLDNIKRNGEKIVYSCTLFGGLGDFFFNLATTNNGDSKKLSDMTYMSDGGEDEFDFDVSCSTINRAWNALNNNTPGKWQYINFMPSYNGYPSDFDTDKVILNLNGTSLAKSVNSDGKTYTAKNGWTIGTLPSEMTADEIRDYRSYLMRPCVRMKEIINACCKPVNNGGYTVNLDPDFFNSNNDYWQKTWLSLPMVQNLEYASGEQILPEAQLLTLDTTGETNGLMYKDITFDIGEINSNVNNITITTEINAMTSINWIGSTSFVWFWNWNGDDYHTGWWWLGSLFVQLVAMNEDTVVGASEVYNLTTPIRHNGGKLYYGHNGHYPEGSGYDSSTGRRKMGNGSKYYPYLDKPIYNVLGKFTEDGFVEEIGHDSSSSTYSTTARKFTFTINNINTNITSLKMVYYWGATADKINWVKASNKLFSKTTYDAWYFIIQPDWRDVVLSAHTLDIQSHNISAVIGENLGKTGTHITKALLLNTESTPSDYLLSYCKMFGLHFTKDVGSKTINILTRKSFYQRNNIVDLEKYIDYSKDISITPLTFSSKWYQFKQEMDETDFRNKYNTSKGVDYGCKILDTGYEFAAEKKDLLENSCIKSGIEGLEKSKWFVAYNNDDSLRPWMSLGLKYTLWNGEDEYEHNAGTGTSGNILPINEEQGLKYYDVFPKVQFHDSENGTTDGNNCLVFFSGMKNVVSGRANPLTYIISDDNAYQTELNDGKPCWLFTKSYLINGKRIAYKRTTIPVFERYLTNQNSGTIMKSLDFGSPQELYVPTYNLNDTTNIYHNFWRTYLTDLFDVNTKQMTCYVKIDDKPGVDWFNRFYWFNNGLWRVNKITDWNPLSYDTTKVEFIKVQDVNNYTSISQSPADTLSISASTSMVASSGGSVTLYITADADLEWTLSAMVDGATGSTVTLSSTGGTGTTSVTATFSENETTSYARVTFTASRKDGSYTTRIMVYQAFVGYQTVSASPNKLLIPATGGTYEIDFNWFNQGDAYIDTYDYIHGSGQLQLTADTETDKYDNKAYLIFPNRGTTGTTVPKNNITFQSTSSTASCSVGVEQLPALITFAGSGGTFTLGTIYSSGAVFSGIPYWLTITENVGGFYTLKANENIYDEEQRATITMITSSSTASFDVKMDRPYKFMRPETLYFTAYGGSQTIEINDSGRWYMSAHPIWMDGTPTSGEDGSFLVTITVQPYSGTEERVGTMRFQDSNYQSHYLTVVQRPNDGEMVAIYPESVDLTPSGGTVTLKIISNTEWTLDNE